MNEKEWIKTISNFVKLNPKTNIYPKINKYDPNAFFDIQNLFKSNLKLINQKNYDEIFSNKKGEFLSGQRWIGFLLSSKNIDDYYINLRRDFIKCNQQKLYESIIKDLFKIYYHDKKTILIEASEVNFDINTRTKLEKIRYFLNEKDWSDYFFNLQKLMHEQIIQFLDWKNKPLNYSNYNKLLIQKLNATFDLELVNRYDKIIQKINLYRNILAKASSVNQKILDNWNLMNYTSKKGLALELYFSLIELLSAFNLI